jgi:hypothetical protein
MRSRPAARAITTVLIGFLAASLAGCVGTSSSTAPDPSAVGAGIVAEVASYQLVADQPGRLLLALVAADGRWLSFGNVEVGATYLGPAGASAAPDVHVPDQPSVPAGFLAIPGSPEPDGGAPILTVATDGRGVYAVDPITLPASGYWQANVHGTLRDGTSFDTQAAFAVLDEPSVIGVGDPAPHTHNPVIGDPDVPTVALDSRAAGGAPIPDPELHEVSIADAIEAGHPALVVFSTPVYCVSRFCGPVTDLVSDLAATYADRADFIHVEIYREFEAGEVNPAAKDWLAPDHGELREPWTFLIGADGHIAASWDTVVTRGEIEPLLAALPHK